MRATPKIRQKKGGGSQKLPPVTAVSKEKKARFELIHGFPSDKLETPRPPQICPRAPCPPALGEWMWTSTTRTNLWTRRTEERTSWVPTRQRWTPSSDNILYMISLAAC